jgi:predicted RNA polymerase sigma factor
VLGALVRRYGHFDACEDAVQEALVAATAQWPVQGCPENPRGWLVTWRWPAITTRRAPATKRRPDAPPANPRGATS